MKIRNITLISALLIVLLGCSKHNKSSSVWYPMDGKVKVLTTTAMICDMVTSVGGGHVDAIPLIKGELDPHSYELVKGDDEKFARADLIFYNGLGLEHGLSLRQHLEHNPKAIAVANPILESPEAIVYVDGQMDPHVWMDIALWMETIDPIVVGLSEKDPMHAVSYRERGEELKKKLKQADEEAYALLQGISESKRYLVTSHDAFHYFTRHYLATCGESDWQRRCMAPEGLAPEAQMSVNDILTIIEHIERYKIAVLFPESNVCKDSLRKIVEACRAKGWELRLCQESLYSDSMGGAASYLEMVKHNVEIIAREFTNE